MLYRVFSVLRPWLRNRQRNHIYPIPMTPSPFAGFKNTAAYMRVLAPASIILAFVFASLGAPRAQAQDLTVVDLAAVRKSGLPKEHPKFIEEIDIEDIPIPEGIETSGYVNIYQTIDVNGERSSFLTYYTTHTALMRALPARFKTMKFKPAENDGSPVDCQAYFSVIYNPPQAAENAPTSVPRLVKIRPVSVPSEEWYKYNIMSRIIMLNVTIDESGALKEYTFDEEFAWAEGIRSYLQKAFKFWSFVPARINGLPVEAKMRMPICLIQGAPTSREALEEARAANPDYSKRRNADYQRRIAEKRQESANTAAPKESSTKTGSVAKKTPPRAAPKQSPKQLVDDDIIEEQVPPRTPSQRLALSRSYQPGPNDQVTQLPTYVVTADRILPPPESWRYSAVHGLEVLANTSTRATRAFMKDFQELQIALRIVWPALIDSAYRMPTLLILCGKGGTFEQFKPNSGILGSKYKHLYRGNSFFVEDSERSAIVVDYASLESTSSPLNDPYRQFYRQYTRYLIRRASGDKLPPLWIEEGLSRLVATIDFTKNWIEFAKIDEASFMGTAVTRMPGSMRMPGSNIPVRMGGVVRSASQPADGSSSQIMSSGDMLGGSFYLMPLDDMFSDDFNRHKKGLWSSQCYAFVHMCMYGAREKYQKGFIQFARRAQQGPVTEDDFQECFGRTHKQMIMELRGYLQGALYTTIVYAPKKGAPGIPEAEPVEVREATGEEIGRIKGEVLRLGAHPVESREEFIVPYLRGQRNASLLASLGLLESLEGRDDRAVKFLEAAAKEGAVRPRAYLALANIRYKRALAAAEKQADGRARFDEEQVKAVLEPLLIARKQPPPIADVYTLAGNVWLRSAQAPSEENIAMVVEGADRFPNNPMTIYNAAALCAKYKMPDLAARLLQHSRKLSMDSKMKARFALVEKQLQAQVRSAQDTPRAAPAVAE